VAQGWCNNLLLLYDELLVHQRAKVEVGTGYRLFLHGFMNTGGPPSAATGWG